MSRGDLRPAFPRDSVNYAREGGQINSPRGWVHTSASALSQNISGAGSTDAHAPQPDPFGYSMNGMPASRRLMALIFLGCWAGTAIADPWPGDAGTEIGNVGSPGGLPALYEPSGAVWHERLGALLVVSDGGSVSRMDADGQNVTTWTPGGDLEGIAIADPQSDLVYLGVERPDSVREFDLSSGTLTGNSWDLTPWMTGPGNQGLEALTHADGLFYAGHQREGNIYVFRLLTGGVVELVDVFAAPSGRDDVSGLHYDPSTQTLYVIHDDFDVIVELKLDGTFIREFDLPGVGQEGITVVPNCGTEESRLFVSQDTQAVWRYELYPASCVNTPIVPALPATGMIALAGLLIAISIAALRSSSPRHSGVREVTAARS